MNFSPEPCVLEGYPDLAFEDQNGSELSVTLVHGGSFLIDDLGPTPVVVPAGGSAISYVGWTLRRGKALSWRTGFTPRSTPGWSAALGRAPSTWLRLGGSGDSLGPRQRRSDCTLVTQVGVTVVNR